MIGVFAFNDITTYDEKTSLMQPLIEYSILNDVSEKYNQLPVRDNAYYLDDELISVIINTSQQISPELNTMQNHMLSINIENLERILNADNTLLINEGTELPNERVLGLTRQIFYDLAYHNIFPNKISTSIEAGICLLFKETTKRLFLEIYNEGGLGYIIEDSAKKIILDNRDIYSNEEATEIITKFYNI